jgi:hypothetical protein
MESKTVSKRITVVLDDAAAEILLGLAGSPRKQGEFLSNLLRGLAAEQGVPTRAEFEALRLQVLGLASELRAPEKRLTPPA